MVAKIGFGIGGLAGLCLVGGCAALPLVGMGLSAASYAYGAMNVVHLTSGGSVGIGFGSASERETVPPTPLRAAQRLAIWPGGTREVRLAERLQGNGRTVVSPVEVGRILGASNLPASLGQLTEGEQAAAFRQVCRGARADLVLAALDEGSSERHGLLSLNRAGTRTTTRLLAFDCAAEAIVWRDTMFATIEMGRATPNEGEVAQALGQAWADRILTAQASRS